MEDVQYRHTTLIVCSECNTKWDAEKIDLQDSTSYVECKCGNLSITRKESEPPSKISHYINVGYSTSIPVITEYLDKTKIRDLQDDKPQKKLGFS